MFVCVYTCENTTLLEMTCRDSIMLHTYSGSADIHLHCYYSMLCICKKRVKALKGQRIWQPASFKLTCAPFCTTTRYMYFAISFISMSFDDIPLTFEWEIR